MMTAGDAQRAVVLVGMPVRQSWRVAGVVQAELDGERAVARRAGEAELGSRQSDQEGLQDEHVGEQAAHGLPPNASWVLRREQLQVLY